MKSTLLTYLVFIFFISPIFAQNRQTALFTEGWRFNLGDVPTASEKTFDDSKWRQLNLPHDWSIEGAFSKDNPSKFFGGALPGGIGWYRKAFTLPASDKGKNIFIDFDGVYRNSEVWINGRSLGKRPFGYIGFRYDLTPFLKFGAETNVIAVKADNSDQPNSRWYSGSGIYRNVWLVKTKYIYVDLSGTQVTTPSVSKDSAVVSIKTTLRSTLNMSQDIDLQTIIEDDKGQPIGSATAKTAISSANSPIIEQIFNLKNPSLWDTENPNLYKATTRVLVKGLIVDTYETTFGIRSFAFDRLKGFSLNGQNLKIKGVCMHHDLGCLGAAVNTRAIERQLDILRGMGCNAIRTSHNPPTPELLDLCDKKGFLIMDESFDVWQHKKVDYDYSNYFDKWHLRDLEDFVKRDRNHPSVIMWSVGNEVWEQGDSVGVAMVNKMIENVKKLDDRPITVGVHEWQEETALLKSSNLDILGFNYGIKKYDKMLDWYKTKPIILTETVSALNSRGEYDMPSDSIRRWPIRWDKPFVEGNADLTCSAYDNVSAPWGNTHEEMLRYFKKNDWMSGMFIWTGFDYLGEPTPYEYPAHSSYFGIVDLAGFPKDVYYLYQSEWTNKPVLHLFPHWNWKAGQIVDVWAYSNADEVELFLNGKSLGTKRKGADDLHFMWRVPYEKGELKAISRSKGKEILTKTIKTAGEVAKIQLTADRKSIKADGKDLSFITVTLLDKEGNIVPKAHNLVKFELVGAGEIAGVDNGLQTSLESFKASERKAYNGQCLVVIQSKKTAGKIILKARTEGVTDIALLEIMTK